MKKLIIVALLLNVFSHAGDITLTGTVVSDGQKMIGSRFMGYINKVYVKIGDRVKREDDLYEMESAEFDIMKSQADLMLEQSKVIVEFWREKLRNVNTKKLRLKSTYRDDNKIFLTDMYDLDAQAANIESMLEAMQIMVKEATIQAKQMASTYSYIKMKAPSDGVVVQKNIKVGDMIMPGMLTIMIVDTENLEIDVSISESIISTESINSLFNPNDLLSIVSIKILNPRTAIISCLSKHVAANLAKKYAKSLINNKPISLTNTL